MGFLKNLFGGKTDDAGGNDTERNDIVYTDGDSPEMIEAVKNAQSTFKYFWRELWWERRRVVPGLNLACVKTAFYQDVPAGPPNVEYMWISDIDFDGINISGFLINNPGTLTNIKPGDFVEIQLDEINDWMFAINGKCYGGFTIQVMRSQMNAKERKQHDDAWGLDFGEPDKILVAYEQEDHPENLIDHPMSVNMKEKLLEFLGQHPGEVAQKDESGYTMLHREAIAGNRPVVEILLEKGADIGAKTNSGHTALDFAEKMGWDQLLPLLKK
ncbi:MAG: DUF2314 domain-containing protein [Spirochaetes bacterium]|nr:DUF2314 domain-containing protein [Spirochaetota bacterium]